MGWRQRPSHGEPPAKNDRRRGLPFQGGPRLDIHLRPPFCSRWQLSLTLAVSLTSGPHPQTRPATPHMSEVTAEKLSQRIIDSGLLDSRQLETVWSELGTREVTLDQFTSLLLRRELLTNFQLSRLTKGDRGGYFYGHYKVLYLTGTGTFAREIGRP